MFRSSAQIRNILKKGSGDVVEQNDAERKNIDETLFFDRIDDPIIYKGRGKLSPQMRLWAHLTAVYHEMVKKRPEEMVQVEKDRWIRERYNQIFPSTPTNTHKNSE